MIALWWFAFLASNNFTFRIKFDDFFSRSILRLIWYQTVWSFSQFDHPQSGAKFAIVRISFVRKKNFAQTSSSFLDSISQISDVLPGFWFPHNKFWINAVMFVRVCWLFAHTITKSTRLDRKEADRNFNRNVYRQYLNTEYSFISNSRHCCQWAREKIKNTNILVTWRMS